MPDNDVKMPRADLSRSFNSTNLRLAALTFILFFAVIWTFSLSSSDPTLNIQTPSTHDEPIKPDVAPAVAPPKTEAKIETTPEPGDSVSPPPAENESDPGPGLPPPPELSDLENPPSLEGAETADDQPSPNPADNEPVQAANPDEQSPSSEDTDPSEPIQPTTPGTEVGAHPDQPPPSLPADELNPLPDPNLEQQQDDGTSTIEIPPPNENFNPGDIPPVPPTDGQARHRTLILYAYSESDAARANIQYFLTKALHSTSDFIFILNGNNSIASLIPTQPNIRVITRENTCYDLGAFGEVLRQDDLYKQYTRFITLNASIRGPFLPMWDLKQCWKDIYLNRVTEETKLVGMTLNCKPRPHVQSMIFATDKIGMSLMLDPEKARGASVDDQFGKSTDLVAFAGCYAGYKEAVHAEIGTTSVIQAAGYKVDVLMTAMHSEKTPEEFCQANPDAGDLLFNGRYFGSNVHPYETVFIKANRDVDTKLLDKMTEWHLKMEGNSYDTCV